VKKLVEEYMQNKELLGTERAMEVFLKREWKGETRLERIEKITYRLDFTGRYNDDLINDIVEGLIKTNVLESVELDCSPEEIDYYFFLSCVRMGRDALNSYIKHYDNEILVEDFEDLDDSLLEDKNVDVEFEALNPLRYEEEVKKDILSELDDQDRKIIEMKLQGMIQEDIGDELNLDQTTISRRIKKIKDKIYPKFA